MKKTIVLLFLALCAATGAMGKKAYNGRGYRIVLTIEGNTDSVMYMGNYYAGSTYASDTAYRDKKGRFVFERRDRRVFPGLYFFSNPAGRHVDFVVYNEAPQFTFATKEEDWTLNMSVKGSAENEIFFSYHRANGAVYDQIDDFAREHSGDAQAVADFRREKMVDLDRVKRDLIQRHPDCFVTLLITATREPDVPLTNERGDTLSRRQAWEYYMDHFFDYMRLDDDAIVRTPSAIFKDRVNTYLDRNLHGADAETVCLYIDKLIERARPSKEAFKWLVHTITEKYLLSNVMSYDAVYVHMVQNYYGTGDNFWSSISSIDLNTKRAAKWDRLLIGRTAIDLILRDDQGTIHQLHAQPHRYTLLLFWSPTCGHCKTVVPALHEKFLALKDTADIGVFAILSEPDDHTIPLWRNFIKEHGLTDPAWLNLNGAECNVDWHDVYDIETTPQVYLLDRNKKILAKKLTAETFEMVIRQLEGLE